MEFVNEAANIATRNVIYVFIKWLLVFIPRISTCVCVRYNVCNIWMHHLIDYYWLEVVPVFIVDRTYIVVGYMPIQYDVNYSKKDIPRPRNDFSK